MGSVAGDELRAIKPYLGMQPLTRQAVNYPVWEAAESAGLGNVRPRTLRHFCGYYLTDMAMDLRIMRRRRRLGGARPALAALPHQTQRPCLPRAVPMVGDLPFQRVQEQCRGRAEVAPARHDAVGRDILAASEVRPARAHSICLARHLLPCRHARRTQHGARMPIRFDPTGRIHVTQWLRGQGLDAMVSPALRNALASRLESYN